MRASDRLMPARRTKKYTIRANQISIPKNIHPGWYQNISKPPSNELLLLSAIIPLEPKVHTLFNIDRLPGGEDCPIIPIWGINN